MKTIDKCNKGMNFLRWSPDGKLFTYVKNEDEICLVKLENLDKVSAVTKGTSPGFNSDNDIIFEHNDEIYINKNGSDTVIVGKNDLVSDAPKKLPSISIDGTKMIFVIDNVYHKESQTKNAYHYRSFLGSGNASSSPKSSILANEQWYGGTVTWFPEEDTFIHYEYDSTGGARLHVVDFDGTKRGTMFGLYPSISPDGKRIACKPKAGQNVVVYTKNEDSWELEDITNAVLKIPEGGRLSGTPPLWLNNRHVIIDEGGKIFKVDTRKDDAVEYTNAPYPSVRGTATMAFSPSREHLLLEIETEDGFELKLIDKI